MKLSLKKLVRRELFTFLIKRDPTVLVEPLLHIIFLINFYKKFNSIKLLNYSFVIIIISQVKLKKNKS